MSRGQSLSCNNSMHQFIDTGAIHDAKSRIIYVSILFTITWAFNICRVIEKSYSICHLRGRKSDKGEGTGRGHYHRRNVPCPNVLGRTRSSKKAYLHMGPINFLRNASGGQTIADRRDEWIIETPWRTDERLLQIFVQLLAVPSLIAHRSAAGGSLGVSLPASLSASLLVVVLLLDGSIANVDRLVIGREGIWFRAESKKCFSGMENKSVDYDEDEEMLKF